uniref:Uncharacterized protein n=1 Tax=Arundo donax TaxID=35708 RepID=A0A0A8ZI97_ARUDO
MPSLWPSNACARLRRRSRSLR